jgi:ABC-2 type transport system permease protein
VRTALAITAVELRRFLKDRSNIFFVFVFPLLLVLFIGAQFGGSSGGTVAVTGPAGALRSDLVAGLEDADATITLADADDMRELVARGRADVGILLTPDAVAAYDDGGDLAVQVVVGTQSQAQVTAQRVQTALDGLAAAQGQAAALVAAGADEQAAAIALAAAREVVEPSRLAVVNVSEIAQEFAGLGQFDYGASSQVLLFVFLTSLTGSTTLIQARRLGVTRRTLAAPVSTVQAVTGQALGRLTIAAFQGAYIMAATVVLFGVDWGNLALAVLVMVVFALVAAGAAMVLGSVLDNDAAAGGVGVGLGLVLAALGGGMYPLELFPDTLRTVAHFTPHAWASEALAEIQRHDGGLVDIAPQLGVLLGFAAVLLVVGAWLLRRSLARAM